MASRDRAVPRRPLAYQRAAGARRSAGPADDPILVSKVTVPAVPDWAIQRPRITELIAQGTRRCPLTTLTGPPGAGKTMALALWAAAGPPTVAWVSLDEFDNRPGTFWSHVVAALRRSGVSIPRSLQAGAPEWPTGHMFLPRLAAALAAQDPPVTLVLDDLHLLTDPKALDGLDFVLRNAWPGLRLAVCSRIDPLLPLHRYRLAGQLTEIRASDLAFSTAEAGLLLAQHGCTLTADSLQNLTRRTEGWAAGLRLAAISLAYHPEPDQRVKELIAEDSALTAYLVREVLDTQPPEVREVLLSTSILDQVSADAAVELTGNERAAAILPALARTNAFIQPTGDGWYRYHPLFAEVLRLKLRHDHPDQISALHRRAARWYGRDGLLTHAVRHAARAGDWQLAASQVIDELAIGQLLQPRDGQALTEEFAGMPPGQPGGGPQPHLIRAGVMLAASSPESCLAALDAADSLLAGPGDQEPESQLAAAVIRLAASLRTGDLEAARSAAARAEVLVTQVPADKLARHPDIEVRVLSGRGAVELWSGHLGQAARVLESALAAHAASSQQDEPADCLGHLALVAAIRGQLSRAVELAGRVTAAAGSGQARAPAPDPAAPTALAWVHVERGELRQARSCLKQADAALSISPDKLIGTVAYLVAAAGALAEGRGPVAAQLVTRARSGWPVPAWLDQQLSLTQSRAWAAAGDIQAALVAAERAGSDNSVETAAILAHAWATTGRADSARRALAPALAAEGQVPDRVRLHTWLADARLSYANGDRERGRRSLAAALQLAEHEQLRLPFVVEHRWIGPVLQHDPELAGTHRRLLAPAVSHAQIPTRARPPDQTPILVVEPLSEREREVLRQVSRFLNTAEIASELCISPNTVKTHLQNIYRKLAAAGRGEAVRRARQLELI